MSLGSGVHCELSGLSDAFGGADRRPAKFHDNAHGFEMTAATRQESAGHPGINYSRLMDSWTVGGTPRSVDTVHWNRYGVTVIDAVEKKLEGRMRLGTKGNFGAEEKNVALAERCLRNGDGPVEM